MVNLLTAVCALYTLPGPPSITFQNGTYQLYPIDRTTCDDINQYRDTIFELYTRNNPTDPQILLLNNDSSIINSDIDFNNPTIIFFHGYLESSQSDNAQQIKTHFLNRGEYNVILVNNKRLLAGPYYFTSARNVEPIGKYSATFIDYLIEKGLSLSQLHIIGMSLGGQIAGITGKNIASGKAARITGLDPAGPYFSTLPSTKRLAKDDGEFVDVVHTNAGVFGIDVECGDVDIWANGGTFQPACTLNEILTRNPGSISELVFCNHYQAYRMYVMSLIEPESYLARKCSSYEQYTAGLCESNETTYLGVDVDTSANGNYYVDTGVTAANI